MRKAISEETLQKTLKFSDCRKMIRKQMRPEVVEKSSDFIFCLFDFVKATKLRDSSEFSECVEIALAKILAECEEA